MSPSASDGTTDGRRRAAATRRRAREAEIIAATRALFDAKGVRDAQIEDIAASVGINRAIVYRHFTGKEELFALTLASYRDERRDALAALFPPPEEAAQQHATQCAAGRRLQPPGGP